MRHISKNITLDKNSVSFSLYWRHWHVHFSTVASQFDWEGEELTHKEVRNFWKIQHYCKNKEYYLNDSHNRKYHVKRFWFNCIDGKCRNCEETIPSHIMMHAMAIRIKM